MTTEEKDLVWLPKSLVKKIKKAEEGGEDYENLVISYLDESNREVRNNLELLEEDVLQYRGLMVKAKQEFKKAKEEHLQASYEVWEEFDKELPSISEKVQKLTDEVKPIKEAADELKDTLNSISLYNLKELADVIEKISNYLSYNSETGKILKYLVKTYNPKREVQNEVK